MRRLDREVQDFLEEIISVCRRHGFSISHEDGHGSFEVAPYNKACAEWLMAAKPDRFLEVTEEGKK